MTDHCENCGKFAMTGRAYCGRCAELVEEKAERQRLELQLRHLKRYRVHHPAAINTSGDLTWEEAVALAKEWLEGGVTPWRVEVRDERGVLIKAWEHKERKIVEIAA